MFPSKFNTRFRVAGNEVLHDPCSHQRVCKMQVPSLRRSLPSRVLHEADEYLVIDPDECIDCAACVPECPVDAIYADTDLPDEEMEWLDRNEDEAPDLPVAEGDSPVLADS